MKLILFDIDGTLLRGHGAGTRAMMRAGRAICGHAFDLEGIMIGGGLDPVIFGEAARRMGVEPAQLHDAFRDQYLIELAAELATKPPELLPGVRQLLAALGEADGVMIGLVTGNYQRAVPIKFAAVDLAHSTFLVGAYGDCGPTRPDLVRIALERASKRAGRAIEPTRTYVIGDTPRDVDCARQNGCVCIAVGTGYHPLDELRAAGAHYVTADLSDTRALMSLF